MSPFLQDSAFLPENPEWESRAGLETTRTMNSFFKNTFSFKTVAKGVGRAEPGFLDVFEIPAEPNGPSGSSRLAVVPV